MSDQTLNLFKRWDRLSPLNLMVELAVTLLCSAVQVTIYYACSNQNHLHVECHPQLQTSSGLTSPVICGNNAGQHCKQFLMPFSHWVIWLNLFKVYMDMSTSSTGSATLAFTFSSTASTTRKWEAKVTQIPCNANYRYQHS